ncbi:MAG: phosphate ABC transporter permease subunit PstC [Thermoprotei archaeon]
MNFFRINSNKINFSYLYSLPIFLIFLLVGSVIISLVFAASDVFFKKGIAVYTSSVWDPTRDIYGGLAAIYGSIVVVSIATVISLPLSLSLAIFLNEYAPKQMRPLFINVTDLMASFPTVIYGFWGLYELSILLKDTFFRWLYENFSWIPLFSTPPYGPSFLLAGILLSIMVTPFASSLIREVYAQVPENIKEGVYALGLGKWEVIKINIKYAKSSIVGSLVLAFGRGIGETVAVSLTVGNVLNITPSILAPGYTIPALIVNQFGSAYYPSLQASALFALALLLFIIGMFMITITKFIILRGD